MYNKTNTIKLTCNKSYVGHVVLQVVYSIYGLRSQNMLFYLFASVFAS